MRKALCVGIDSYSKLSDLHGCVNDANSVSAALARNGDGSLNFDVQIMCATSENSYINKIDLKHAISELFRSETEIALLYFSGHGAFDSNGGYICTSEVERSDFGLSLDVVMREAGNSKAQNTVIILDCCFSGAAATHDLMQEYSLLKDGTTILAACGKDEYATEKNGHGVFTSLMVEALYGGAMNLLGEVSPASIYSYIDRSLGAWEQRPVFKANISNFVSLRKNTPPIQLADLRRLTDIFQNNYEEVALDPTYEPDKHEADTKEVNKANEEVFSILQKYVKLNLVTPVGTDHMYYAAINRKSCRLTARGQHYWNLVKNNRI